MTPLLFAGVALAGGLGAALRLLVDRAVLARAGGTYPWGITIINLTGSFAIGFVAGLAQSTLLSAPWVSVLAVGLLGGYTTFSTVAVETALMVRRREWAPAVLNGAAQLVAAVALAAIGMAVGAAL